MAITQTLGNIWQKIALFAYALDYDERTDMAREVDRLAAARKDEAATLAAVSARVDALSQDVRALSERIGTIASRTN